MKKYLYLLLLVLCFIINNCYADETMEKSYFDTSVTYKYYKTTNYYINNQVNDDTSFNRSTTEEITESEYNNARVTNNISKSSSVTVETTYKKLAAKIVYKNNRYFYEATLHWKNMPAKRSYDIIGIGFPGSVSYNGYLSFTNSYTSTGGASYSSSMIANNYIGTYGVGVVFVLPTIDIVSMDIDMSFAISKVTSSTINTLYAYSDYSHATKTISLTNSKKYYVDMNGIELDTSILSYYDTISRAEVTLSCNW